MNFHAHVYFRNHQEEDLLGQVKALALGQGLHFHMNANRPVGPHPFAMAEFHFIKNQYGQIKQFFQDIYRQFGLTTLLHIDTGDDVYDHKDGAEWIGPMVELDFEFFELIKKDPSKRIHKN